VTPTHPIDPEARRAQWESAEPITIEDNVWLGSGAIVCPGVTIGENTVVGAGAVVTRDLPAGVVAVGTPARVLRGIGEHDRVTIPEREG
jgi:maltose O-acetyltransferase